MANLSRRTAEGFQRLIAFSDAVVAIALTLLVLPLADIPDQIRQQTTVGGVLADHWPDIISFAISFIVIWVLWRNHHRMMEYFRAYDRVLFELHFVWLLTIVVLPFATAVLDNDNIDRANVVYIGVLALSILSLVAMAEWGARHPELMEPGEDTDEWLQNRSGLAILLLLVVALVIAIIAPGVSVWPLLLLLLSGPTDRVLRALGLSRRRRTTTH